MQTATPRWRFDPTSHDSHLVAMFHDEAAAEAARTAVLEAGLQPDQVLLMSDGQALHQGMRHPVQDLFVPEEDYQDYHHALARGRTVMVVRPPSPEMREAAVRALEAASPLDPEEHGRNWRGTPVPVNRFSVNHATVSKADMHNRAIGGRDEVILDMTGQKMTVRTLSGGDMTAAPFARVLTSAERSASLAPPPPERQQPVRQTSYTYGVPAELVKRMSAEEQVMAQPHTVEGHTTEALGGGTTRGTFLRVVDGQTRVGWREQYGAGRHVRSYVTERSADAS